MDQIVSNEFSLLILSYPSFAENDLDLIQDIRRRLDPDVADYLKPHFTHVLPLDISWERTVVMAAKEIAEKFESIQFSIKTLTILDNPATGENFLVLVLKNPEQLLKLHLDLYNRMGLPSPHGEAWRPHLTVGVSTDREMLIAEAKQLKASIAGMSGIVKSIEVVKWRPGEIETIANLPHGKS